MTPVEKGTVTSTYGWRKIGIQWYWHNGIDMVAPNLNLRAIWRTVKTETVAGWNGGRGNTAYLYYSGTLRVLYQHLQSFSFKAGYNLKQGDIVGVMGYTGHCIPANANGRHLHIEVQILQNGRWLPVEPSKYIEVKNVLGSFTGNNNLDGGTTPPSKVADMFTLEVSPVSSGDKGGLESLANSLQIPVHAKDIGNNLFTVTIGAMTNGDKVAFVNKCKELQLAYKEV